MIRPSRLLLGVACAAAVAAAPRDAAAQALTVAAASDLQVALPAIAERFQRDTGHAITPVFGSSGNFFAQIQNGAPFDVFFSADVDYPRRLDAAHLTEPGSLYTYAIGRLVVWARRDSGVDVSRGLVSLDDPRVMRIAIANPEHAPYGRAAVAALQHEHLYDRLRSKLVLGENISQAAQFVQSGAADAGIIALSLARAPDARAVGVWQEVPASFHPPIEQAAVILASSRHKDIGRALLAFLRRPEIVQLLADYGFTRP